LDDVHKNGSAGGGNCSEAESRKNKREIEKERGKMEKVY